jgi:hypothetical protein
MKNIQRFYRSSLALLLLGCGGRPDYLEKAFVADQVVGLDNAVVVPDRLLNRALVLTSPGALQVKVEALPIGQNLSVMKASSDGRRLFVLSRGVTPRRNPEDESPRLTVIETDPVPRVVRTYQLTDSYSGIELDPSNEWAVLYVTPDDSRPVSNPREILLVDLVNLALEPAPMTVQSGKTAGSPQAFAFTSALSMPDGGEPRRLLVIQLQNEVTLVDLSPGLSDDERTDQQWTVEMPTNQQGAKGQPAEVVFHDATGELGAELAVRLKDDTSVMLLPLDPPSGSSPRPFLIHPNLVDVGGLPASIDFVNTGEGVRLAALVGNRAALVDSGNSAVLSVTLPQAFTDMTLVTDSFEGDGTDIALLWSASAPTIGLWRLALAESSATHGVETLPIGSNVRTVRDVPGDFFPTSKILEGTSGDFYVLDLAERLSAPMVTNGRQFALTFAPDGQSRRLWAYAPSGTDFSSLDLTTLNPTGLSAERAIWSVFDIAQSGGATGRSALVLHHFAEDLGATVLDALNPDDRFTRFYSGLAYGGLTHE